MEQVSLYRCGDGAPLLSPCWSLLPLAFRGRHKAMMTAVGGGRGAGAMPRQQNKAEGKKHSNAFALLGEVVELIVIVKDN